MSTAGTEILTEPSHRSRRRPLPGRSPGRGAGQRSMPYLLIAPTVAVLIAILGYPLYLMIKYSLQEYKLRNLLSGAPAEWVGLDNYTAILTDGFFWTVVARTFGFAAVCVAVTILGGTLVALLMQRVTRTVRALISFGLVFVWAIPPAVGVPIWQWMVDFQFGVFNWVITRLGLADYTTHNWFANPWQGFAVVTALIVWGAIPFVAITLYAGLSQVPKEMVEAAVVDGAGPWQIFWNVTMPILRPVYAIVITLSIIWDFQVFNQVWIMLNQNPTPDYYLLGIYAFTEAFRGNNYGLASAIAIVTVLLLLVFTFVYVRQMLRVGEAK